MNRLNLNKLHILMYTLLYPAVLGTMVVGLVFSFTERGGLEGENLAFAVFLLFYFGSQHVENADDIESYSIQKFFLDFIEIIFIFGLFLLLQVYSFEYSEKILGFDVKRWPLFYICLAITFLIPVITRRFALGEIFKPGEGKGQSILSISAFIISLSALCGLNNFAVVSILSVILIIYLIFFVFNIGLPKQVKKMWEKKT